MPKHPITIHYEKKIPKLLRMRLVALFFHIPQVIAFLNSLPENPRFQDITKALEVKRGFRLKSMYSENIPTDGPLIVVANHPHILIDQLSIGTMIESIRPHSKIRIITDNTQKDLKSVYPYTIQIGKTPEEKKIFRENINTLLQNNGTLIVFPGAKLTHRRWFDGAVKEGRWRSGALHFARYNSAPIIPIHVTSKTSMIYNFLSNFFLRSTMQGLNFRQALKKEMYIGLTVGKIIHHSTKLEANDFRDIVYNIGNQEYILPKT